MTWAKIKDPGGGLPILTTEQAAGALPQGGRGQQAEGLFLNPLPRWPGGPCLLEQKGRVGRGASEGKEATGWDRNVKEGWFASREGQESPTGVRIQCLSS